MSESRGRAGGAGGGTGGAANSKGAAGAPVPDGVLSVTPEAEAGLADWRTRRSPLDYDDAGPWGDEDDGGAWRRGSCTRAAPRRGVGARAGARGR
jgi:hypothetical protein